MKPQQYDIVCVAQPAWSGPYAKSTVLLMKQLAVNHRILYVDYASTWKDLFVSFINGDFKKAWCMLGLNERIQMTGENDTTVAVLTLPPVLPLNFLPGGKFYRFLNKVNSWTAAISIRKAMRRLKFDSPVVINAFTPALGSGLLNKLNERATFYYCYDEITQAAWNNKHGGEMEECFAKEVNAVIVSSDALKTEKLSLNSQTLVVKNGVDTDVFFLSENELQERQRPIVGFVGSLDSRIDYQLLIKLIEQSPEFQFQFIGRATEEEFDKVKALPNVEWIPPVDYNRLPGFIQNFDVGIIPFVKSSFTEKIYPLKINEYLAMGKPVVMTSFASLPEFNDMVSIAEDANKFKEMIVAAVRGNSFGKMQQRESFAKKNSWKKRADEFSKIIGLIVSEKE